MADKPHIVIMSKGGRYWTGGRQYTLNLLEALIRARREPGEFDVSVLLDNKSELPHYEGLRSQLRTCADSDSVQLPFTLARKAQWRFQRTVLGWVNPRIEEALDRIGATFTYPLRSTRLPSADWIPDFQYKHFPDGSNPAEIAGRKQDFAACVRLARHIVLSSAHAEGDCHELFPQSLGRTSVLRFRVFADPAWLTPDPLDTVRRYHLPQRFVLISNALIPTKNHGLVLEALATLPAAERSDVHVVCTGDLYDYRNPGFYNGFIARIHELGVRDQVSVLGLIPKQDQTQLLRASLAYLQPSLFEGWNTGVEEAHLFGKPILLSDIPVHREQLPPRSIFFDPRNATDLAARMKEVFAAPDLVGFDASTERRSLDSYGLLRRDFARDFLDMAIPGPPPIKEPGLAPGAELPR